MAGKIIVVAGAQFGSEGKGAVAAALGLATRESLVAVRVAGPNAGHTVVGNCPEYCISDGTNHVALSQVRDSVTIDLGTRHLWKLRSVPVAAVTNPNALLIIAAGSEVDLNVLESEISALDSAGYRVSERLFIDRSATLLTDNHIADERNSDLVKRLGSTAKGIGAARADRVWRSAPLVGGDTDTVPLMYGHLRTGATVLIEGTQGYGLGTHAGFYPQCTSSDCRAIDFLSMAGLSPWHQAVDEFEVWLAARVRPIRVAGNSGPLKDETTWENLGLPVERTTVTNKVRRVGEWDGDLVRDAVEANGGNSVNLALTMVDTVIPQVAGMTDMQDNPHDFEITRRLTELMTKVSQDTNAAVQYIGTGPDTGFFI